MVLYQGSRLLLYLVVVVTVVFRSRSEIFFKGRNCHLKLGTLSLFCKYLSLLIYYHKISSCQCSLLSAFPRQSFCPAVVNLKLSYRIQIFWI